MADLVLKLFIQSTVALLMIVTIIYCWRLNTRIRVLQDSKSELSRIIREFDEATTRATQSIAEIHEATRRLNENMQHKIDKANFLADDLQYMIEKASKLSGKPEPTMPGPRPNPPPRNPSVGAREPAATKQELASRAVPPAAATPDSADSLNTVGATARRTLRMRSRAEQELIQALGKEETGN